MYALTRVTASLSILSAPALFVASTVALLVEAVLVPVPSYWSLKSFSKLSNFLLLVSFLISVAFIIFGFLIELNSFHGPGPASALFGLSTFVDSCVRSGSNPFISSYARKGADVATPVRIIPCLLDAASM